MQTAPDSAQIVDDLAHRAGRLFSLPAVAVEILRLTEDPNVEASKIKECIEKDPAITIRVLRVVNSSLFGSVRKVDNLGQAVAMLGIKPLKLLVLGFSLPPDLFADIAADQLRDYWLHSLTKAVLCRGLSESLAKESGDEAFLTGLLADIGQLVLIQELGEPYAKLLEEIKRDRLDMASIQRHAIGIEHTALSSALLQMWDMPELFYQTIDESAKLRTLLSEDSEQPIDFSDFSHRGIILTIAQLLTEVLTGGNPNKVRLIEQPAQSLPHYSPEALKTTSLETQEKVESLAEIFSVRLPKSLRYEEVIEQAFYRMSDFAMDFAPRIIDSEISSDDLDTKLSEQCIDIAIELRNLLDADKGSTQPMKIKPVSPSTPTSESANGTGSTNSPPVKPSRDESASQFLRTLFLPVEREINHCRNSREPLSLLLVEQMILHRIVSGPEDNSEEFHLRLLHRIIEKTIGDRGELISIDPHRWAILMPGFERRESVEIGGRIIRTFSNTLETVRPGEEMNVKTAVGISMVDVAARNFDKKRLITAAVDCLHGSIATDGGIVKSIEVY